MRIWVALLLVLPFVGASQGPGVWNPQEASDVRLHFHVNGVQDFPINTQEPAQQYAQSLPLGLFTHSQGCADVPLAGGVSSTHHTYYGYGAPGHVEYRTGEPPKYSNVRGLSRDAELDAQTPPIFDWYLEAQAVGGDDPAGAVNGYALVVPEVVVRATWRQGDDISVDQTAFNEGAVIARGESLSATLSPFLPLPDGVEHLMVDGRHVYHFRIPLAYQETTRIDAREGMNVRIDVFMDVPCGSGDDDYAMLDWVRIHTSKDHRPGMDIRVFDAVRIDGVHTRFDGGDLVGDVFASSPFGFLDIGGGTATAAGAEAQMALEQPPCNYHNCESDPRGSLSWRLPVNGEGLVLLEVHNLQKTAWSKALLGFDVGAQRVTSCGDSPEGVICQIHGPPPTETTPPVGLAFLLLALVGATLRRRGQ